jgi:prophage regulatory protein
MEETKLLRFKTLREYVPSGRTTIWRMVKDGRFPAPVRIGKNGIAWRSDEVQNWIKSREKTGK